MRRRVALTLVATMALGACGGASANSVAEVAKNGGGYIAGDGTIITIPAAERSTDIRVQGATLEGAPLDTGAYRGQVVVINTWGSWCPPCNAEARDLQQVWESVRGKEVKFVGVDLREGVAAGKAFQRKYGITYPSVTDGNSIMPQLKGKAAATPTTLVLDRQGRLAARVSGQTDATTLRGLIEDVVREPA